MKKFVLVLILLALMASPLFAADPPYAITGTIGPYDVNLQVGGAPNAQSPCGCKGTMPQLSDDAADMGEAVARGLGGRLALGPYRGLTLALRQMRADVAAGRTDAGDRYINSIRTQIGINPQKACTMATFAVLGLEMANAFGANIPPSALAAAIMLQQQLCNQPPPAKGQPTLAPPQAKRDASSNWLSTQYILDGCAGSNGGCGGDDNTTVLGNAKNGGIPLEADYGPYAARNQGCQTMTNGVMLYTVSDWGYADPNSNGVGDTALIKAAIFQYGGVGVAVAADNAFMKYSGGVFSGNARNINHDVYLVGWDDSKGAWLMLNSWSSGWGVNPANGQKAVGPVNVKKTGLVLPPLNIRQAKHAAYRARNMRAITDLAKRAKDVPPSFNAIATQPPMEDQGGCGSCWDFSGIRVVSAANILSGFLPKSPTPITGGAMWIKYGANEIGTEPVWGVAGKPIPYVAPPGPGPGPGPAPSPTRRASILAEKATRLYSSGIEADKARVLKAIKAAEDVFELAP